MSESNGAGKMETSPSRRRTRAVSVFLLIFFPCLVVVIVSRSYWSRRPGLGSTKLLDLLEMQAEGTKSVDVHIDNLASGDERDCSRAVSIIYDTGGLSDDQWIRIFDRASRSRHLNNNAKDILANKVRSYGTLSVRGAVSALKICVSRIEQSGMQAEVMSKELACITTMFELLSRSGAGEFPISSQSSLESVKREIRELESRL